MSRRANEIILYHSIDICYDLATKLRDPILSLEYTKASAPTNTKSNWIQGSFAWGVAGVACFYALMNQSFPDEGWSRVSHSYLQLVGELFESCPLNDLSLFSGFAGYAFTAYLCSQNGMHYRGLLSKLDEILENEVQSFFLKPFKEFCLQGEGESLSSYNIANGLSGVLIYLIHRQNNTNLARLTYDCLEALVAAFSIPDKVEQQRDNNQWCISYGISGVLALFALALQKGLCVPGQKELMVRLFNCIRDSHFMPEELLRAGYEHSFSSASIADSRLSIVSEVTRGLYLAAEALRDLESSRALANILCLLLERVCKTGSCRTSSFYIGRARMLMLAYQMGIETNKPEFFRIANKLEQDVKYFYSPSYQLGFSFVHREESGSAVNVNNPNLLNGVAGLGMVLLSVQGRCETTWSKGFIG